jgi:hypothetical protein
MSDATPKTAAAPVDVPRIRADLERAIAEAEASSATNFFHSVYLLRESYETAARARLGADEEAPIIRAARAAVRHGVSLDAAREAGEWLKHAEAHEVTIGTGATSAGEGVASRVSACTLMLARAWLLLADPSEEALHEANRLASSVRGEPNARERLVNQRIDLERAIAERYR